MVWVEYDGEMETGEAIESCVLVQDVSIYRSDRNRIVEFIGDYGPEDQNPNYGGWYFWDQPEQSVGIENERGNLHWQAHVYLRENPTIDVWWGAAAAFHMPAAAADDIAMEYWVSDNEVPQYTPNLLNPEYISMWLGNGFRNPFVPAPRPPF